MLESLPNSVTRSLRRKLRPRPSIAGASSTSPDRGHRRRSRVHSRSRCHSPQERRAEPRLPERHAGTEHPRELRPPRWSHGRHRSRPATGAVRRLSSRKAHRRRHLDDLHLPIAVASCSLTTPGPTWQRLTLSLSFRELGSQRIEKEERPVHRSVYGYMRTVPVSLSSRLDLRVSSQGNC